MFGPTVTEDKCASYITEELNGSICTNNVFQGLDLRMDCPPCFGVIDPLQKGVKTRRLSLCFRGAERH